MPSNDTDVQLFEKALNFEEFQNLDHKKVMRILNLIVGELIGTALFVYLGCAAHVASRFGPGTSHLAVCLTFGFGVGVGVIIFANISYSYLNPAVSVAALICGRFSIIMCVLYILAECIGGILALFLISLITPKGVLTANNGAEASACCCNVPQNDIGIGKAIIVEVIGTAILCFVVCSVWDFRMRLETEVISLKLAAVVTAIALPTVFFTGCSLNPARSLGPAVITGYWDDHWVFWLGPMLGAIIAALVYSLLFKPSYMLEEDRSGFIKMRKIFMANHFHTQVIRDYFGDSTYV